MQWLESTVSQSACPIDTSTHQQGLRINDPLPSTSDYQAAPWCHGLDECVRATCKTKGRKFQRQVRFWLAIHASD